MDSDEELREEEDESDFGALKAALHFTVHKLSQDCGQHLNVKFSPAAIVSLTEEIFETTETFGKDLELFAKHAKRSKVTPDDVKLLFRNNPGFCSLVDEILDRIKEEKPKPQRKAQPKKRKTAEEDKELEMKQEDDEVNESKESNDESMNEDAEESANISAVEESLNESANSGKGGSKGNPKKKTDQMDLEFSGDLFM